MTIDRDSDVQVLAAQRLAARLNIPLADVLAHGASNETGDFVFMTVKGATFAEAVWEDIPNADEGRSEAVRP